MDNYHTDKHLEVEQWLEHHKRVHLHFTPTSASWMNQVEIWFYLLHRGAIQRGVFKSVAALRQAIQRFLEPGTTAAVLSPGSSRRPDPDPR